MPSLVWSASLAACLIASFTSANNAGGQGAQTLLGEQLLPETEDGKVYLGSWAVIVDPTVMTHARLKEVAAEHGLEVMGQVGGLNDTYLLHRLCDPSHRGHCRSRREAESTARLYTEPGVHHVHQQHEVSRRRHAALPITTPNVGPLIGTVNTSRERRAQFSDPLFNQQWYYHNTKIHDHDANVYEAWDQGVNGTGVVVCIVDDGIEHDHPDIVDAYDPEASSDFNSMDDDPFPDEHNPINNHGTRCSGVVASQPNNDKCGVGVGHGARIGGIRMLDGPVSDVVEANSLGFNPQHIDIYSSSWGPNDDGRTVEGPGPLAARVFEEGVSRGRGGLGSIFLFASGNGGEKDDCNCDGYSNSVYTIAISALTEHETMPYYAENCAASLASIYSNGGGRAIVTIDLRGGCITSFSGTSAAAPLASGLLSLVLQVRPDLTWRDMQHVVVHSAVRIATDDKDWSRNGAGLWHSHKYGFGKLRADRLLQVARSWINLGSQYVVSPLDVQIGGDVEKGGVTTEFSQEVTAAESSIRYLEHVQIVVNLNCAGRSGRAKFQIFAVCPDGTSSRILSTRRQDNSNDGFQNWTFMTVRCWGTSPIGTWKLLVINAANEKALLANWQLVLRGTSFNPLAPGRQSPHVTTETTTSSITTFAPTLSLPTVAPTPGEILTTTSAPSTTSPSLPQSTTPSPSIHPSPIPAMISPTVKPTGETSINSNIITTPQKTTTIDSTSTPVPTSTDVPEATSFDAQDTTETSSQTHAHTTRKPVVYKPKSHTRPTVSHLVHTTTTNVQSADNHVDDTTIVSTLKESIAGFDIPTNFAVSTGIAIGVVTALILILIAFGIKRWMTSSHYETVVANSAYDPDEPFTSDEEDDLHWADKMDLSAAAFEEVKLSEEDLEEIENLATT